MPPNPPADRPGSGAASDAVASVQRWPTSADPKRSERGHVELDRPVAAGVHWELVGSTLDIVLAGDLCVCSVPELQPVVLDLLVRLQPADVVIDLSDVTFADARAANMLVHVDRLATLNGAVLRLAAPSTAVARLLGLCGMCDAFEITTVRSTTRS